MIRNSPTSTVVDCAGPATARAKYIESKRAEAAAAGRPTQRTNGPGLLLSGQVRTFLFRSRGKLMVQSLDGLDLGGPVQHYQSLPLPVDGSMLGTLVRAAYDRGDSSSQVQAGVVLVADQPTLALAVRLAQDHARTSGDVDAWRVSRAVSYRAMAPISGYLPVLTDALSHRFWLPTPRLADRLAEWASAFGFDTRAPMLGLPPAATLASLVSGSSEGSDEATQTYRTMVMSRERSGTGSAQFSGAATAARAFDALNGIVTAFAAMSTFDLRLAGLNEITGEATRAQRTATGPHPAGQFTAVCQGSTALKVEVVVALFADEDGRSVKTKLDLTAIEATSGSDSLRLRLRRGSARSKGWHDLHAAFDRGEPVYLVREPYVSGGFVESNATGKWASREAIPFTAGRAVPADVSLAGAPPSV